MNGSRRAVRHDDEQAPPSRRVAIAYHFFPHYRAAVLEELCRRGRHQYLLAGDTVPTEKTIKTWDPPPDIRFVRVRCWAIGPVVLQPGLIGLALRRDIDTLLLLGVVWYPFSWVSAILARLTGKRVVFWTHGWIKPETGVRRLLRRTYYRLAHAQMYYGHMGKMIAIEEGFDPAKIHVVYNSVDYEAQKREREKVTRADLVAIRRELFGDTERPIAICTTRLIPVRRLDLLLEALAVLKGRGKDVNLLLVGDGPERPKLQAQAAQLGVTVKFYGACYDEAMLARLVMASNVTVAPGKVGLTAMTSLGYGRPVVTHDDPFEQMPEWEAIIPGKTGSLFRLNDVEDLARAVEEWTGTAWPREEVCEDCYRIIERFWNARFQRVAIERAIDGKPADDLFWLKEDIGAELRRPPRLGPAPGVPMPVPLAADS